MKVAGKDKVKMAFSTIAATLSSLPAADGKGAGWTHVEDRPNIFRRRDRVWGHVRRSGCSRPFLYTSQVMRITKLRLRV